MMVLVGMPVGMVQASDGQFGWWLWPIAGLVLVPFLVVGGLFALGWWF
jgi:hypothetical protein